MADKLQGKRIAFLVAPEGVEQVELTEPWKAVESEGATPELISLEKGEIQAFNHLDKGDTFPVDRTVAEASASDYDALVLPGGVANPDILRMDDDAVAFVARVLRAGQAGRRDLPRPVDAGRGRRRSAAARSPRGRRCKTDIRNAGGTWVDEEVVVDEGLVSSRNPDDLPAFCAKIVEEFCEGVHEGQRDSVGSAS